MWQVFFFFPSFAFLSASYKAIGQPARPGKRLSSAIETHDDEGLVVHQEEASPHRKLIDGIEGCSSGQPCEQCYGDCDEDSDCVDQLICYHRSGFEPIPGCKGIGRGGNDYCTIPSPSNPSTLTNTSFCSQTDPCGSCTDNCTSDEECYGDLMCYRRDGSMEPVPGCIGTGTSGFNYCTEPELYTRSHDYCSSWNPCGRCTGKRYHHPLTITTMLWKCDSLLVSSFVFFV